MKYQGLSSYALPNPSDPGIFTLADGSGAIQHGADYRLVTAQDPARKGEVIIVYATGLGRVSSPPTAGGPSRIPSDSCGSSRTGVISNAGDVLFAGLTPGFPGLYQVNIQVSPNLASGQTNLRITLVECVTRTTSPIPYRYDSNSVRLPVQ